ncbi:MAG: GGDEF domain-containing protein, partial [Miltoncostaeaceae bacterium]
TIGYSAGLGLVAGVAASGTGLVLLAAEGGDPWSAGALGPPAFLWAVLVSAAVGSAASERELRVRAQRLEVLHRAARGLVDADTAGVMVDITRRAAQRVMPGWSVHLRPGSAPSTVVMRRSGLDAVIIVPVGSEGQGFGVIECRRPLLARVAHHGVRARDLGPLETLAASLAGGLARARALASLERRSLTDELTGLGNRRSFDIELARRTAESQRTGRPVSMCLIDIDNFKAYNDAYGHLAGDDALAAVANAVRGSSRLTDIASRYGGEELALILPGTAHEHAIEVAERVRTTVAGLAVDHRRVTVSIGVATGEGDCSAEVLVEAADRAMYAAKAAGRDRVVGGSTRLSPLDAGPAGPSPPA